MRGPDDPILGYCSRLLRGGEGDPSVAPAVLAATVRAHGVAGLLLETAPMSQPALAPQRVVLMGLARQDAVRDMAATLEVRRVLDILDEAGIASLVLKGTALALWLAIFLMLMYGMQRDWPMARVGGLVGGLLSFITPFKPGQALGMALLACVAGSLGHLVMKALKRDLGITSWGMQGMSVTGAGGLLDRVDALCFAAPVFFHSARWYFGL